MENFSEILIGWYKENKRDLPWRETNDPYLIWVSEIILQQTRVAQGYDYYRRFVRRFPDVGSLAEADEDEVMKYWQGLGYYSRARNMHAAAVSMVAAGGFPRTYPEVLALKGVGAYTAAAICSFAYGMPYAVVDGNVYRVLARWLGIDTPIDTTEGKKMFADLADELLDRKHPGIYNQAIMDFGAMQCTPAAPDCMFCPLADSCMAHRQGKVDKFPVKQHKTRITSRYFTYIYIRMGAYTFIRKRTGDDIWKNLYEFPLIETDHPLETEELLALPQFQELFDGRNGVHLRLVKKGVKHVLSHRVIYADFYEVCIPEDVPLLANYRCVKVEDLQKFAVSRLVNQFFSLILSPEQLN